MGSVIKKLENLEDFQKVYKVFSGEPYNEMYTEEELEEIFREYEEKGYIYGAFNDDNKCMGLIAITRGQKNEHPVDYPGEKVMYLSDIAVLDEYRRTGLGSQLIIYGLMESYAMGYSKMYMRTLEKGKSMSYGIANKVGFTQIPGVYQMVDRTRLDGNVEQEKNIFLDIDLKNLNREQLQQEIAKSICGYRKAVQESVLEI